MKIKPRWLLIGLAILALTGGMLRALSTKHAQQLAAVSTAQTGNIIELTAQDVLEVDARDIVRTLDISGTIKAVRFAAIKSRVAGEIREILVREGDSVKNGQTLARIDPIEYHNRWQQAKEQADAAKSQLEIAQRQWDSNKALVEQGFISKIALDNSQASLQGAIANHRAAVAGAEVARKALDDSVLRAPFKGVIASRLAQEGERVPVDIKVLELVDPTELEVEVPLSASDSVDVQIGQSATLQVEGRPALVPAKVKRISPSAQAGTRSVLVFLSIDAAPGLRHGLFVKGQLSLDNAKVLAVPLSAVRTDRAEPYVQVVEPVGERLLVVYKTVKTGLRGIDATQPESELWVGVEGLNPGSTVIKGQIGRLRDGLEVRYSGAAATSAASAATSAASAP